MSVCGCECVNSSLISRTIGGHLADTWRTLCGHGDNCWTLGSLLDRYGNMYNIMIMINNSNRMLIHKWCIHIFVYDPPVSGGISFSLN